MDNKTNVLVYGYGNPGRQDDGLAISLVEKVEQWVAEKKLHNVATDSNYQLNIEDAANIAEKDLVIFVDASQEHIGDIAFTRVHPDPQVEYTMHAVSPGFVLHLCNDIYEKHPETFLLHIRGYEWEMQEGLTEKAQRNLDTAFEFIKEKIKQEILVLTPNN